VLLGNKTGFDFGCSTCQAQTTSIELFLSKVSQFLFNSFLALSQLFGDIPS